MHAVPTIRKVFQGVATRHEMYRMFNRHRGDPAYDQRSGKDVPAVDAAMMVAVTAVPAARHRGGGGERKRRGAGGGGGDTGKQTGHVEGSCPSWGTNPLHIELGGPGFHGPEPPSPYLSTREGRNVDRMVVT